MAAANIIPIENQRSKDPVDRTSTSQGTPGKYTRAGKWQKSRTSRENLESNSQEGLTCCFDFATRECYDLSIIFYLSQLVLSHSFLFFLCGSR
jgi:hypothetical protein